jgi:hypothetical protein
VREQKEKEQKLHREYARCQEPAKDNPPQTTWNGHGSVAFSCTNTQLLRAACNGSSSGTARKKIFFTEGVDKGMMVGSGHVPQFERRSYLAKVFAVNLPHGDFGGCRIHAPEFTILISVSLVLVTLFTTNSPAPWLLS